jgi:hypothetical protein
METIVTSDLSNFGNEELEELAKILNSWIQNRLPKEFTPSEVTAMFNAHTGGVYLTNRYFQCAKLNADTGKLELVQSI